jgi:hypothetical protein
VAGSCKKKESSSQGRYRNRLTVEQLEKVVAEHQILAPYDIVITSYLSPHNIEAFSLAFYWRTQRLIIRIAYINS